MMRRLAQAAYRTAKHRDALYVPGPVRWHVIAPGYRFQTVDTPFAALTALREYTALAAPPKGATVIDAGAYTGHTALAFASLIGQGGRVVAIEPDPANLSLLKRNLIETRDRGMIEITIHPAWVEELLDSLQPYQDRVTNNKIFKDIDAGTLTLEQFRGGLINFYPLIESFPQYMALNLAKVPTGNSEWNQKTRSWLITNINQERIHTLWWRHWATGKPFEVANEVFSKEIIPPPEMDAINNYLWRICTHGSLAEGISASNLAVEGPTGVWTKKVISGIKRHYIVEDAASNERTLAWVAAHAHYDDKHPAEALEILKAYATTREEQVKVKQAAKRALEYYALALDACYELFK
jgi:pyrroloquinoline quinone (PQQ) biosynthesis protein C